MDNPRLFTFLAESFELWGVRATVEPAEAPIVAAIHASDGSVISVERITQEGMPFRWIVRRRGANDAADGRQRPCGSLVGVLSAIRNALGVDRGNPVRIAPAPGNE